MRENLGESTLFSGIKKFFTANIVIVNIILLSRNQFTIHSTYFRITIIANSIFKCNFLIRCHVKNTHHKAVSIMFSFQTRITFLIRKSVTNHYCFCSSLFVTCHYLSCFIFGMRSVERERSAYGLLRGRSRTGVPLVSILLCRAKGDELYNNT